MLLMIFIKPSRSCNMTAGVTPANAEWHHVCEIYLWNRPHGFIFDEKQRKDMRILLINSSYLTYMYASAECFLHSLTSTIYNICIIISNYKQWEISPVAHFIVLDWPRKLSCVIEGMTCCMCLGVEVNKWTVTLTTFVLMAFLSIFLVYFLTNDSLIMICLF